MEEILRCENISKSFGKVTALRDLVISTRKGEILGIIGPNGAGKTTLFNVISGSIKPDRGRIIFDGRDITRLSPHEICRLGIARTHQLIRPFKNMTVLENVLVGLYFGRGGVVDRRDAEERAKEIVSTVGLDGREDTQVQSLNVLGQKLVELARAIATEPRLLLLDEPIAGLNTKEIDAYLDLITMINKKGVTMMIVEHVLRAVMSISDRVVVIHNGTKIFEGLPREASRDSGVVEAYLGEAE